MFVKKIFTTAAVGVAAAAIAMAPAAPAQAGILDDLTNSLTADFVATTVNLPTLTSGSSTWITGTFLGKKEVKDFKISVVPTGGITASYPNDKTFTSLSVDSTLSPLELDYIALKLNVPSNTKTGVYTAKVNISYTDAGKAESYAYDLPIAVVAYTGGTFTQVTKSVNAPVNNPGTWVNVSFVGVAPTTDNLRFKITNAQGATVSYPSDGANTGLNKDANLGALETDAVAFKVSTTGLAAGTKALTWEVTYGPTGSTKTTTGTLNLVVS